MKRASLFLIGLLSAIITIVSLNYAFGKSWFYNNHYSFHGYYYDCYHHNNQHTHQKQSAPDSSEANY